MSHSPPLILISAMTRARVIGRDGRLPWNIPDEYRHFLSTVSGNTVLMGRTSYEIFGPDLPHARVLVVSSSVTVLPGVVVAADIPAALELARSYGRPIFSSGGAMVYRQTLPLADELQLSFIKEDHPGDRFFPAWDEEAWEIATEEDRGSYDFRIYRRRNASDDGTDGEWPDKPGGT